MDDTSDDITDEKLLRARFDEIDVSGDGSLDPDELLKVFQSLNKDVTPQLIANLVRLTDEDGNGTIEWPEFLKIFQVLSTLDKSKTTEGSESAPALATTVPRDRFFNTAMAGE